MPVEDVLARLADDLAEASRSARYAGQDRLANQIDDRVEVLRWDQSRRDASVTTPPAPAPRNPATPT